MENEIIDLSKEYSISNLFRKFEKELKPEFNEHNWIDFHYKSGNGGMKAVRESIEMIGNGVISERYEDHLMYVEYFKEERFILVVHAQLSKSPYGGSKGYYYQIGVYRNDPRTEQIGGGYGTSGIITINHTNLLSYVDYDIIHYNRNVVSKVCNVIKNYILNKYI